MKKFVQNDNNYAFAYYRYSSNNQSDLSIPDQQVAAHHYAESRGLQIIREFWDEALSGTTGNRPYFQQMLVEIEEFRPAALIVWKVDRLARSRDVAASYRSKLERVGVEIMSTTEHLAPPNTSGRVMQEGMLETFAEVYSQQLSENVRRGMTARARSGRFLGHPKFGYRKSPDFKYEIDPDTAPVVQKMFADYASGVSAQALSDELNGLGITTASGGEWTVQRVTETLGNDRYIGVYRYRGNEDIVIEGGIPALVDVELFERVQKRLALNKRQSGQKKLKDNGEPAPRYWLTGKVYCGHCGETMRGTHGTSRDGSKHYYYACKGHQQHKGCKKKHERKDDIERLVLSVLKAMVSNPEIRASMAVDAAKYYAQQVADNTYLRTLESRSRSIDKSLKNLLDAIEQGVVTRTTKERMLELEAEREQVDRELLLEQARSVMAEDEHTIAEFFERYAAEDFEEANVRDGVLDYLVDAIYLYDDKIVIVGYFSDTMNDCSAAWSDLRNVEFKPIGSVFEPLTDSPATETK